MKPNEWNIPGPTGRCAATGQPIPPGADYHTVLYQEAGQWVRKDYAVQAFPGPPANVFAHWQGHMPIAKSPTRPPLLKADTCLSFLERTATATDERTLALRYVAALFLWRRRRLHLQKVDHDSQGRECLHWHDGKSGRNYTVIHPQLSLQQLDAYQTELSLLAEEESETNEFSRTKL